MKHILTLLTALLLAPLAALHAEPQTISLAGTWQLRLENARNNEIGMRRKWFLETFAGNPAVLPGTLQVENRRTAAAEKPKVAPDSDGGLSGFTTLYNYRGTTWYQREVEIPDGWAAKHIELTMERCMWESYVWVDAAFQGTCNSLATPHVFDLSKALTPGKHRLTIAVDNSNSRKAMSGAASSAPPAKAEEDVNNTMTKFFNQYDHPEAPPRKDQDTKYDIAGHQLWSSGWSGIVGRFELRASDAVRIVAANAYPMVAQGSVRLKLTIDNGTEAPTTVSVHVACAPRGAASAEATVAKWDVTLPAAKSHTIERVVKLNAPVQLWNEDTPNLYEAVITLAQRDKGVLDRQTIRFGLREFGCKNNQFTVNGRTVFLRGEQDSLIFPLTVAPPTTIEPWRKIMSAMKDHGLNHLRFHTCCPPEAAFAAADEAGVLLEVETAMVNATDPDLKQADPAALGFVADELRRILDAYGNHPSFFAVAMGNEQGVKLLKFRSGLVKSAKQYDPRHLYSETAGVPVWEPAKRSGVEDANDFIITASPISGKEPLCGIQWGGGDVLTASRFNTRPPETLFDYRAGLRGLDRPLLTHEVGQWAVYPDLREIARYTGAQRAFNYELIRDRLADKGLLPLADEFTRASGMLALALYKEEIESALRTPGLAGFQLLQLHDYPGQGTATVGLLNSLWESKGLVTPAEFRAFCAAVTPLARFRQRVWTAAETLTARIDLANYGAREITGPVHWRLTGPGARTYASGQLAGFQANAGQLTSLGEISVPLGDVSAPAKVVLSVDAGVPGQLPNQWEFWVYPPTVSTDVPSAVTLATVWNEPTKALLRDGRKVLLVVARDSLPLAVNTRPTKADNYKSRAGTFTSPIPGNFTPVFWSMMMKRGQLAQTMGVLCDPAHPALAKFPTEFHSNWQWWDPVMRSAVMQIDPLPKPLRPIVGVVDNFRYNQRLAMVFEAKVGNGKLIVCSSDILKDLDQRPVARQLRRSLLDYMAAPAFSPVVPVSEAALDKVLLKGGPGNS